MSDETRPDQVEDVARWLRSEIGVPFVVVGGSATGRYTSTSTKDVDVLIRSKDWSKVDRVLERRDDATALSPHTGTIRDTLLRIGDSEVLVEFLSDRPFRGTARPDEFADFVRHRGSVEHDGVRYATPAVVFYMRLNAPDDWREYVPSIERDLVIGGLPESTLDEAVRVAERFGRAEETRRRVEETRRILRHLDPRRE